MRGSRHWAGILRTLTEASRNPFSALNIDLPMGRAGMTMLGAVVLRGSNPSLGAFSRVIYGSTCTSRKPFSRSTRLTSSLNSFLVKGIWM